MIISPETKHNLLNKCLDIIIDNPDLFELGWVLDKASKHLTTKKSHEIRFWKKETLRSYSGIETVFDKYMDSMQNLCWFVETKEDTFIVLSKAVILSTISEFAKRLPNYDAIQKFIQLKKDIII